MGLQIVVNLSSHSRILDSTGKVRQAASSFELVSTQAMPSGVILNTCKDAGPLKHRKATPDKARQPIVNPLARTAGG